MGLFNKKKEQTADEIIDSMVPEERAQVKRLVRDLTNELMEKTQNCRMLEKELKNAVKRKKPQHDPMLGKVSLVMFSRPKVAAKKDGERKVRMHSADNVQGRLALQTMKAMLTDPDNDFIGAHFMLPMKGKSNAYERLETNAEAAWHLFQCLDQDMKKHDPENKKGKLGNAGTDNKKS